jgi:tetratricopeptide (TPR) repeat protein
VRVTLLAALFATIVLLPAGAEAAPTRSAPTDARALELFEQSAKAYREGHFQEAVDKLLEARRFKAEPVLLYNLGRAYEALGKPADAADAYAKYLEEEPEASDRKAIEGRVATLRGQANELAAARREPEDSFAGVPWIVIGVGAASLATGAVLGILANGKHDDAVADPVQRSAVEKQDSAEGLARAATVTLIAGAVIAAMGVAWLGVRAARPSVTSRGPFLQVTF